MLKEVLPPILFRALRGLKPKRYGWIGHYASWQEAVSQSEGYDKRLIVDKVKSSLIKVVNDEAVFERDSVLFYKEDFNHQLLSAILYAYSKHNSPFHLIDFGGSLGSSFFQNQKFLKHIKGLTWNIIEQNHFVEIGKKEFESEALKFYYEIEDCLKDKKAGCLLLSSVLQYLEYPFEFLSSVFKFNFETIIIDRMPFNIKEENRIAVQKVHPEICDASYPCHLLDKKQFVSFFESNGYELHSSFDAIDGEGSDYTYKGYIFEKG